MNRLTIMAVSALAVVATASGALTAASASAATSTGATTSSGATISAAPARPMGAATCPVSRHNYAYPHGARTFGAWSAGSVTVAPVNKGTIKVVGVKAAPGWRARVDTRSGSSVDVYFRSGRHLVKFEAEISDSGGMTVLLSRCGG